jgi:periplasmic mercuric ion binding protein
MKLKHIITSLLLIFSLGSVGQSKITTATLEVDGLCGMCKKRIENAAYIKGVKQVEWSTETHELKLVYRNDKVQKKDIIAAINEAGHDVKDHPATDEQYANIHGCCRFRDPEQRAAHGLGDPLCKPGETHEEHHAHGGKDKH